MKSGVNISLKLFDIETNTNGMTLLNPFAAATTESIRSPGTFPFDFHVYFYFLLQLKNDNGPFFWHKFPVNGSFSIYTGTLIQFSVSFLARPIYLFDMSTE